MNQTLELVKAKKKNSNTWLTGVLVPILRANNVITMHVIDLQDRNVSVSFDHFIDFEIDPETICHHIGRNDESGTAIFENDFVEDDDIMYLIVWENEYSSYMAKERDGLLTPMVDITSPNILGNYYSKNGILDLWCRA